MTAAHGLEIEEFLTWLSLSKGRARNTISSYRRDLHRYHEWLDANDLTLETVSPADLDRFVEQRRSSGLAPATVARSVVSVRALHRFLDAEEYLDHDPSAELDPTRVPRGLPKPLSEAEVVRLLEAPLGDVPASLRDRAMLETLYGTGVRISELVGLSLGDLDVNAGLARVLGKGDKERIVPVGRQAADALEAWLGPNGRRQMLEGRSARRGDADAVFLNQRGGRLSRQGAWGIVSTHACRAGLGDKVSPHVLRHSCATHMVDHGADVRVVQELLGHASITTTQVYTMVSTERLQSVYRAAHPRATRSLRAAD